MNETGLASHLALWAKTAAGGDGPRFHPLGYHLLDVAAVAERLLGNDPLLARLATRQGVDRDALARFTLLLVALHDIGKACVAFQRLAPELAENLAAAGFPPGGPDLPPRAHGAVTACYLGAAPKPGTVAGVIDALAPGLLDDARLRGVVDPIAGHHGRPVEPASLTGAIHNANKTYRAAAGRIAAELADALDVAPLPNTFLRRADHDLAAFSWLLAALTPVADWIGSNTVWFPPHAPDRDLAAYWTQIARPAAARAVADSGLAPAPIAAPGAGRTLPAFDEPTPLQHHLLGCALPDGPSLFVIEDATGAGKTEAALTLAHRLMWTGRAEGLTFCLPTTATADAMFLRLGPGWDRLFHAGSIPSTTLFHGRARDRRHSEDRDTVGAWCSAWIADDRRKAFLAQTGVGTIDQALLAVLPTRYQTLRVHGLRRKVVIVDEAHAYDPYMRRELEALLELQAMLGGSAILLSATLPLEARRGFARAFARGLGAPPPPPALSARAYPLVTSVSAVGADEAALDLALRSRRSVAVARVGSVAEAEDLVVELADRGACVAVIRSTVDAAIDSFDRLAARLGAARVGLLHSRFLPEDRARHERAALRCFGKTSQPHARRGRVLVATQVIEQGLDIDFDAMVSDLAPIDLLIQRAGRLQRHARDDRPVGAPVLHVISPPPRDEAGADWLDAELPEAGWVYRDVALLWMTARRLFEAGAIDTETLAEDEDAPMHVRRLVDAVYEAGAPDLPTPALRDVADRHRGKGFADRTLAQFGLLDPVDGYVYDRRKWDDETQRATRLEEPPRATIRLAREDGGRIVPLAADGAWASSEVRASRRWAAGLGTPDVTQTGMLAPTWQDCDAGALLAIMESVDGGSSTFAYDPTRGLVRREREDGVEGLSPAG